ncbi:MAG: tRNA pseudouridine(55) synthase TruB [Clostridia bacterium]|nr:tRNA pseudouridine(55) synthase TruB [Clostridia bacterium]
MYNGFINLNKPADISSNRALSILKRALKQNNIITKVGHFGTLDPIADGVLPVALGRATRLFDYSLDKKKRYIAKFCFGVETDTLDRTGTITSYGKDVSVEEIKKVLPELIGTVEQIPPRFSAKTINGVRAYKLARKGQEFDLSAKTVIIDAIDLVGVDSSSGTIEYVFDITCGGGTYIRSIVRDMASLMGTVGIMTALTRTASGFFTIEDAHSLEEIADNVENCVLPMDRFLEDFPKIRLDGQHFSLVKNGVTLQKDSVFSSSEINKICDKNRFFVIFSPEDELLGIAESVNDDFRMKTWLL